MRNIALNALALTPLAALALLGCKGGTDVPDADATQLQRFSSCEAVGDYMTDVVLETLVNSRYSRWYYWPMAEDAAADDGDSSGSPSDYTTTNVQEQGVDELDFVKTDGNFIYIAQNNKLTIVKSWPAAESAIVSEVELGNYPYGMFLNGDDLAVFSYAYSDGTVDDVFARSYGGTRVTIFDVSDRSKPTITRTFDVEGWLSDGRMIDGRMYFAMNSYIPIPNEAWELLNDPSLNLPEWTWEETDEEVEAKSAQARAALRPAVEELMAGRKLEEFLPLYREQVEGAPKADAELMHACNDIYRPADTSRYSVLSIVQLDVDGTDFRSTGLLSDGWEVYASQDNLYVAQSSWWWWWGWGDVDLQTNIHKFELGGDEPKYVASGSVPGWTLNQFSYSEHEGALRVATTDIDWWWGTGAGTEDDAEEPANNVFVLEDDGAGELDIVGEVRGIAPNEQIRAARFMGDRGFLVTFEQIDPLFTLDLSDNTAPKVVGELKMPGFSAYLHPMGEDHLLAVGMSGTMDGEITGLGINIFDVSDFANPKIAHSYEITTGDWAGSEALWDHHAFTYHRETLSIPTYIYDWSDDDWSYFSGLLMLKATPGELTEVGRIDHADLVKESECLYEELYGYEPGTCDEWYWYAWLRRSIYIEDNVYSISDYGIKVNDLNDPKTEIAEVKFFPRD